MITFREAIPFSRKELLENFIKDFRNPLSQGYRTKQCKLAKQPLNLKFISFLKPVLQIFLNFPYHPYLHCKQNLAHRERRHHELDYGTL